MNSSAIPNRQVRVVLMALLWLVVGQPALAGAKPGAPFEDVGRYTQTLHGKQATLDLSKSIFVTIGLSYSF